MRFLFVRDVFRLKLGEIRILLCANTNNRFYKLSYSLPNPCFRVLERSVAPRRAGLGTRAVI